MDLYSILRLANVMDIETFLEALVGITNTYMHAQSLSCVQLFVTPWTGTHQTALSMKFFTCPTTETQSSPSSQKLKKARVQHQRSSNSEK